MFLRNSFPREFCLDFPGNTKNAKFYSLLLIISFNLSKSFYFKCHFMKMEKLIRNMAIQGFLGNFQVPFTLLK